MRHSRLNLLGLAVMAIAAVGMIVVWDRYRAPARIATALPAMPDLSGQPGELRDRMRHARASASEEGGGLDAIVEFGKLCHANGFVGEAEACWRILMAERPQDARWSYYLADLRRAASDNAGMAAMLEQTTSQDPTYAPAWLGLADLLFKGGNLDEAGRAYQKRLELLPGDPHAHLGLARIDLQEGRRDLARNRLARLVKDAPAFPPGHNLYAEILAADGDEAAAARARLKGRDTGRFREAEDPWLDQLIDWCFNYDELCRRGAVDALTRFGDRGKSAFERAIELRPSEPTAYQLLAGMYKDLDDLASARGVYELGIRHVDTPSAELFAGLSRIHLLLKQPAEAVRIARAGLERTGENGELYDALGTALGALGNREGAVDALRAAVMRNPRDADANYNLAVALVAVHRLDEAIEALHRSLEAQPTFPATLALLAQVEIDSGRWQSAVRYLQPLYEAQPELPEAREKMVHCHLRAGAEAEDIQDLDTAIQHYRSGLAIEPDHAELLARLGALLLIQRRFAEAVAPLESYHRVHPDNPQSALFLGQAYVAVGRRDEARQILSRGAQLAEQAGNAKTAQRCREILLRLP